MTSSLISRASALVLLIAGLVLLFASDVILPRLITGFPVTASWLGELLAGAWLGMAALNWYSRAAMLGGIYGRPIVTANVALYLITALALLRAVQRANFPVVLTVVTIPMVVLAIVYGWLLLRGPLARDFDARNVS